MASLSKAIESETQNIKARQSAKAELEEEVAAAEQALDKLRQKLEGANAKLEEVNTKLAEVRDASRKTQKDLDRALKEIAEWNDDIEKSASDRHAIYRKCRLEEIDLPLVKGSLDKVPLMEVSHHACWFRQSSRL